MRCESCGHEWRGNYGDPCPSCGTVAQNPFVQGPTPSSSEQPGASPWESPRSAPTAEDGAQLGDGIPWENEQSSQSLFETMKRVLVQSQDAFAAAHRDVGIGPAFTYVLILGIAGGMIAQVWSLASTGFIQNLAGMEGMEGMEGLAGAFGGGLVGFVMVPFYVVIGVFVGSGLLHLCLMIVGGANAGFESTFRVYAYAYGSTAPMQIIPVLGSLVAMIWSLVVMIMGIKEIHQTSGGKAAAAVLLPILLCCCCIFALAGTMAGAVAERF